MNKYKLVLFVISSISIIVVSSFFYYFYASDCCISPTCTECFFEGEIPCICDEYVESKQYDKVCDECHNNFCGAPQETCSAT